MDTDKLTTKQSTAVLSAQSEHQCCRIEYGSCAGNVEILDGVQYCVLHRPTDDKLPAFIGVVEKKLGEGDTNFKGAYFPPFTLDPLSTCFPLGSQHFEGDANFQSATFASGVSFFGARFHGQARFDRADFGPEAIFCEAIFDQTPYFNQSECTRYFYFSRARFLKGLSCNNAKFGNFDFDGATVAGQVSFNNCSFSAEVHIYDACIAGRADFERTQFYQAALFEKTRIEGEANFKHATFYNDVLFATMEFGGSAVFAEATFKGQVEFRHGSVAKTLWLDKARFDSDLEVIEVVLSKLDLWKTKFAAEVVFIGHQSKKLLAEIIILERVRFAHPELVYFYNCILLPRWFVDVDPTAFKFIDTHWAKDSVAEQLKQLEDDHPEFARERLTVTYRQLAANAEARRDYSDASILNYNAWSARRTKHSWREHLKPISNLVKITNHARLVWRRMLSQRIRPARIVEETNGDLKRPKPLLFRARLALYSIPERLYGFVSGYGENAGRALAILAGLVGLFTIAYCYMDFALTGQSASLGLGTNVAPRLVQLNFAQSLTYSLSVMTLQVVDIKPMGVLAQNVVTLERILGPLQAALLALAIRRKFMR